MALCSFTLSLGTAWELGRELSGEYSFLVEFQERTSPCFWLVWHLDGNNHPQDLFALDS